MSRDCLVDERCGCTGRRDRLGAVFLGLEIERSGLQAEGKSDQDRRCISEGQCAVHPVNNDGTDEDFVACCRSSLPRNSIRGLQ